MVHDGSMVSLGFTENPVPVGSHICQIYSNDAERNESLLQFLLSGLLTGERTACFSEKVREEGLADYLGLNNISYNEAMQNQAIALAGTRDVYFHSNVFDPDSMLSRLSDFHQEAIELGFSGARVIGEMIPEVQSVPGGERLLEYESRVSLLLKEHPVTCVCQYNADSFSGAAIMDILKIHPHMIIRGKVVHNPFYVPPEEFLKNL